MKDVVKGVALVCSLFLLCCLSTMAQPKPMRAVEPLLRTKRVQSAPFNNSCPYYNYGDSLSSERCLVGCVATAIEQLLSYYRHPLALLDSIPGWSTEHYSLSSVPAGTPIYWDDVADLSLWCGMMVRMNYSPQASAASMWNAEEPLRRVMGYKTVRILDRSLYNFNDWHRILQNELLAGRPVAYVGYNVFVGGHAFNIDGMNLDGLYHCNWGENENTNGYFSLEHLNEFQPWWDATEWGRLMGCHANEYMLLLHPDSITDILQPDTLQDFAASVRLDSVQFRREIDNREYVLTDVTLTNLTSDTLYHTYMVLQNAVSDTALLTQSHPVSLTSLQLLPHATRTQTIPCHFTSQQGECIVSITFDDLQLEWSKRMEVIKAVSDKLSIRDLSVSFQDNNTVQMVLETSNGVSEGTSGRLLYFRLFPKGAKETCSSDFRVLNLPAGQTVTDTLVFRHLSPLQEYELRAGTWSVPFHTVSFTMPSLPDAIEVIPAEAVGSAPLYDLLGRRLTSTRGTGVYIRKGKLYIDQ